MKNLVLLLFTICSFSLLGQDIAEQDMVYMKDGSVFVGKLKAYEDEIVKFQTGDVLATISKKKIKKIVFKGQSLTKLAEAKKVDDTNYARRGFYNISYASLNSGSDAFIGEVVTGVGIGNITGKQINQYLGLGLGVAYNSMYVGAGENLVPIFIDVRGYFREKKVSPFYNLGIGYNFVFENEEKQITDAKGGIMIRPAVGFKIGSAENSFIIDLGYNFSKAEFTRDFGWETRVNTMTYRRFELRIGLLL